MLHLIVHEIVRRVAASTVAVMLLAAPGVAFAQAAGQSTAPATGGQFGATAPAGENLETRQFKDWMVRCGRPQPDAPEACEMVQQPKDEKGQTVLFVAVGKVANTGNPGMLIILPLGIALPPGVVLKVDEGEEIPAPVQRCERHGCEIELLLEPKVLALLKAGQKANVLFQIRDQNGEPKIVAVPFSLFGFTSALNEVMA
jgi:invasion protein IalB